MAFTLIEILVAIGIVVTLMAIATPAIVSSFADRRIEAEAERLAAAMASLRAESVRRQATLALYLEPAEGEQGGELFIGPIEQDNDVIGFPGAGDGASVPAQPLASSDEETLRTRSIFKSDGPLTLTHERPTNDPALEMLSPPGPSSLGSFSAEPERIRIAVCTASGQILASRPVWLHDERSMFRVEVGTGVGNAVLSGKEIIPETDALDDERPDDELVQPNSDPASDPAAPGGTSP